jgi:hypothetical protein
VATGERSATIPIPEGAIGIALSPDGKRLVVSLGPDRKQLPLAPLIQGIRVYDVSTGGFLSEFRPKSALSGRMLFSPDGQKLVLGRLGTYTATPVPRSKSGT